MAAIQERTFLGSLNHIDSVLQDQCADNWTILVETALPAAGDAFLVLLKPQPGEILEEYLDPTHARNSKKGGRSPAGRRRKNRWNLPRWWLKMGLPHVDGLVSGILPGRAYFKGRQAGSATKFIFTGINIVDAGLFAWMMVDVSRDFVMNWSSNLMEGRFCTQSLDAVWSWEGVPDLRGGSNSILTWPWIFGTGEPKILVNKGWNHFDFSRIAHSEQVSGSIAISAPDIVVHADTVFGMRARIEVVLDAGTGNEIVHHGPWSSIETFPVSTWTRTISCGTSFGFTDAKTVRCSIRIEALQSGIGADMDMVSAGSMTYNVLASV